jgi:hypothetical protein
MTDAHEKTREVSDPNSPDYDPNSPHYDVTADSSSPFYVGPVTTDHKSGDEIRNEVTSTVDNAFPAPGSWLGKLFDPMKDPIVQSKYEDRIAAERDRLVEGMDMRSPGEAPKTMWENASHEQMVEIINSNADSAAVAVTSEEWVRLGNDLSEHQRAFGAAINDSLSNWEGEAGDAARKHLAEVAKWMGGTANGAVLTGRQQEIHSQSLNETQKAMAANPPVPFSAPEANARLARIADPMLYAMAFSMEMQTYHQHQAARDQAAQVMTRFDETMAGSATTPKFTAPPALARTATARSVSSRPGTQGEDGQLQPLRQSTPRNVTGQDQGFTRQNSGGGAGQNGPTLPNAPELPAAAGTPNDFRSPNSPGDVPGIPGSPEIPAAAMNPEDFKVPGGPGSVPDLPGGSGVPGSPEFPAGGVPGGGVPGMPGGGPEGGQFRPSIPELPGGPSDTSPSGFGVPGGRGSTDTAAAFKPQVPAVPDLPAPYNVPSGSNVPGSGSNVPGSGFVPPIGGPAGRVGGQVPGAQSGGGPQSRPFVPDLPPVPDLPKGTQVPGGRFGAGSIPEIPGGGGHTLPGGSMGGPGAHKFGGPGGGGVPGIPGGGGGGGGIPGGGPGAQGAHGSLGASINTAAEEPVVRPGAQGVGPGGPGGAPMGGAPGGAPMGGMPMGGGAGGKGGDDKERKSQFIEGDPSLFAADTVAHPTVIGDWANQKKDGK